MKKMKTVEKIPIPIEVLEMTFDVLDQEDVENILNEAKEIDLQAYNILLEIALRVGKIQP